MSNTYFQFKKFIVHQDKSALKVCTDACCLGALIAPKTKDAINILDLGTGTGLLSLMLAQMNNAKIIGIDIHEPSVEQSKENFAVSLWRDRLTSIHADINNYVGRCKFDWIICNPPFFENLLKSPVADKDLSKHLEIDGWNNWVAAIDRNMSSDGKAAIMVPYFATEKVKAAFGKAALYTEEIFHLYHQANKIPFRSILIFQKEIVSHPKTSSFIIREEDQSYTENFKEQLAPYYLYL